METKHLYSPSTSGFYPRDMQAEFEAAGTCPDDLVDVADEDYDLLMQAPSIGKRVVPGPDGYPIAEEIPGPSAEEIATRNKAVRDGFLAVAALRIDPLQDAEDLGMATAEESAKLVAWKRYRVDLIRTDITAAGPTWPETPQ